MINQESAEDNKPRARILQAALDVIAERASPRSPARIYWSFKDKDALLEALLRETAPFIDQVAGADPLRDAPPREVLGRLAEGFLRLAEQPIARRLLRIFLSEAAHHEAVASSFAERGPLVVLRFLERYLAHQAELGRLRPLDPAVAARAFMGSLVIYALGRELFPPIGAGLPEPAAYRAQVVATFLDGLRPRA